MFGAYYNKGQKVLSKEADLGEVWISGFNFAHDIDQLRKNGIGAVCSGVNLYFSYPEDIENIKFDLNDCDSQDARYTFEPAFNFIEAQRKKTNVLVHCAAGISRCSTLLISYMMKKYGWNFDKCLKTLT